MGNSNSKIETLIYKKFEESKSKSLRLEFKSDNHTLSKGPNGFNRIIVDNRNALPIEHVKFKELEFTSASKKIIDEENDRRRKVPLSESSKWPFCSIGKITGYLNYEGLKREFFGTGTLIGPNVVLTCAQNVYDLETKSEFFDLEFFPALNDGTFQHSSKVIEIKYPDEYKLFDNQDTNQFKYDYALLFLEENFEDNYGYLGLKVYSDNEQFQVSLYGYSRGKKSNMGKNLVGMEGPVNFKESMYLYTDIDTLEGQSGSGLFKKDGEEYYITGIHVGYLNGFNQAVKINKEKLLRIKTWVENETYSTTFDLDGNEIGDEGMKHLSIMNLQHLQGLYLGGNQIGDEGIKHLSTINLLKLQGLYLQSNLLGDVGMKHLSTMKLPQLQGLYLRENKIGDEGMKHLSDMKLPQLQGLYLQSNKIGDEGMKRLTKMNLPQLEELDLHSNKIGYEGMKHLSTMNLPQLQRLNLWSNQIEDGGMKHLTTMNLPRLQELDLHSNKIGDEGMKHLSKMKLLQLQKLDLYGNNFGDEAMKHLSTMNVPQLQRLDLQSNKIGDEGMKHLSKMNLPQLQRLDLCNNKIGYEGMNHLTKMNLPQLQELDLHSNKIGYEEMKKLKVWKPNLNIYD